MNITVGNSTSVPREVLKWIQSLDLSYSVKNSRKDFCNGFLVAEIISRYHPAYVQMHSFDNSTRYAKKKDNWEQIKLIVKTLKDYGIALEVTIDNIDDLIQNTNGATINFVKKLYTQLAQKPLPEVPKLATSKDKTAQWEGTFLLKDKELVKLSEQEDDFFKTEDAKAEKDNNNKDKQQPSAKREDMPTDQARSVRLPKGPQKLISSEVPHEAVVPLDFKGNLKQVTKSLMQIRAEKEGNAHMLKSTPGDMFQQTTRSKAQQPIAGPSQKEAKTPLLDTSHQASRVFTSEGQMKETKRKTNYEILGEILTYRVYSDFSKELAVIKFNNDTLTAILSSIDRLDPSVGACLIQEMLNRKEEIVNNCLQSLNDSSLLYTIVIQIIRKFRVGIPSFDQYVDLLIEVGKAMMEEPQDDPFIVGFLRQFNEIHLKRLCEIITLDPSKAASICKLIGAHCSDSVNSRIQMLKRMKDYLAENQEALTYTFAKMLELETTYNDVLFDIYMYYAMSGLTSSSSVVRVSALRMLNVMASHNSGHNYELAFNLVDKLVPLIKDEYWEVKAQLCILACWLLSKVEPQQNNQEDMPSTATKDKAQNERNIFKSKLDMLFKIMENCVDEHSSLLIIKIALYSMIPLLNGYKRFYNKVMSLMLILPPEMMESILEPKEDSATEEAVPYTYSNYIWLYPCKLRAPDVDKRKSPTDIENEPLDKLTLMRTLAEYVGETKPESLDQRHYQLLTLCARKKQCPSEAETWYKIFKLLHEYFFLALADSEICDASLSLLNRFFCVPNYQDAMFTESRDTFEKTLALLYGNSTEVEPICRDKLVQYVKGIDEKAMKSVKEFFMDTITSFKTKFPAEFEASNLKQLFSS